MTWQSVLAPVCVVVIVSLWQWWRPHRAGHFAALGFLLGRLCRRLVAR
jgi:hypothetical protein